MDSADEKLINNGSRKTRMRAHSFSLSFFSDNTSNTKASKKLSKKSSKKSLQQQSLNDRIPSLPFQYSRKTASQLNGIEKDDDAVPSRKSLDWNPRVFRKAIRPTNESDEFGCCGIADLPVQSPVLSIGTNADSPNQMPFEVSTPLDHPACMLFQDHDEDSLDMATLLDHTLLPIMTTSPVPFPTTTKMPTGKRQSTKGFVSSTKNMPLYSPSHSSASASSASCSSSSDAHQLRSSQLPISSLPMHNTTKAPRPARSLPSLRSTFARAHSDSVVDINRKPSSKRVQDEQNSLGLCLGKTMLQLDEIESSAKSMISSKQRSPLRERRQKPPLHINPSNPASMVKSAFSPASATPANLMTDGSIFSPTMRTSGNPAAKMTLRMRRSKAALLSPPPCPPPTTPLPVIPFSPSAGESAAASTPPISKVDSSTDHATDLSHGAKEEVPASQVKVPSSTIVPSAANTITPKKVTDTFPEEKQEKAQIREEKGLSYQSVASAQFSETSFDSYQTVSRSSYETPKRMSKASMYLSTSTTPNEMNKSEDDQDNTTINTDAAIQVEQISLDDTIQSPSSDVHIIGYAF
ncbi:uncharacterized protein FA14DRAFT_72967 [Meira miltonrushii]|uniref:Uncharacterized protein n=1 Tax=Meira miltonrushii TaxID=1280837 RepID=A0A316VBJ1_9BASI|nr:uncharacterized protein FA14DRAFT_72967 [Meira miltonrushii]PWN34478.1 hypothetical protein FA14DRAFT_72967 [Meira miltonrushii]